MCDQDQFEEDRREFERRGLITRREFGALVGAGTMMLRPE
jgi:carboxymethylenebutenolidase